MWSGSAGVVGGMLRSRRCAAGRHGGFEQGYECAINPSASQQRARFWISPQSGGPDARSMMTWRSDAERRIAASSLVRDS